jgi:hypothetical protein
MKKTYWFSIFSEDNFRKLLCYILLPLLVTGSLLIMRDEGERGRTIAPPFRVPDDIFNFIIRGI